ncbi:YqaA family protein [Tabrizicola sp.]|uniref:YqaA family protein n=1 Tax=Tabrizicola sp. TaxID=2005166 RepID=UPI00286A5C38|nr:YqaA family protein [Tabrizicola sp.]
MTALLGMFVAAFLAASPVPFQSEVVFLSLAAAGWPMTALVAVASVGNILGSCLTYALGRGLAGFRDHRWFPLTPPQMDRAEGWFRRWGVWVLLISWAPGGDLAVAMAGVLRVPLWQFVILVTIAKTSRYAALALAFVGVTG